MDLMTGPSNPAPTSTERSSLAGRALLMNGRMTSPRTNSEQKYGSILL